MALIPPGFLDCVVALGVKLPDRFTKWTATGFLYGSLITSPPGGWPDDVPRYHVWLVTNKHVVEMFRPTDDIVVRFDTVAGDPAIEIELALKLPSGDAAWQGHADRDVDVAVTYLNSDFLNAVGAKVAFFTEGGTGLTLGDLQARGVSEGQGGFLLGFPMSMVNGPTNAVIVRKASIARIRDTYGGHSKTILFDGSVYPGNSGGAAILHPDLVAIEGTEPLQRAGLAGVVASYVPYQNVAISQQQAIPESFSRRTQD